MPINQLLTGPQAAVDGQTITARGSRDGAAVVTELHGKYYEAAYRGQVFIAGTVVAGAIIPVAAATLNSKFTLHNPAGSGKNVELISMNWGIDSATTVVNGHGLLIQRALSFTGGIPTTVTTTAAMPLGNPGTAVANCYTQATLTNAAIPGVSAATAIPIPFYGMFSFGAVTAVSMSDLTHNFDGRILLGPDSLVAACTTVAPSVATFMSIIWAEYPA